MAKKLAIDWDDIELRLVAAQCSGSNVKVTDVAIIPIAEAGIQETLRTAVTERGLEKTETLVAIGRGKAELRELTLPPVPDDELPDMVRFQAIRSFASAGDSATVDYLVTNRKEDSVSMIAAAVGPVVLSEIEKICESAELTGKRIALRPLSAAALYLSHPKYRGNRGDLVLIDLLADDAEIVVARDDRVIFVRTVRMPTDAKARTTALMGELRRSLMASGVAAAPDRVVLWGRASVHQDDIEQISKATGAQVEVLDPFDLVDVDRKSRDDLPDHVGRLAPLVGLLASDGMDPDRLIDFLNPRKRPEEPPNHLRKALMFGAPVAAALLLGFLAYRQFSTLDTQIETLKNANASQADFVAAAKVSLAQTEAVDVYLDGGVNWLDELRTLASEMPPADKMIVRTISAVTDQRTKGGGRIVLSGAVTQTDVIEQFEQSVRDESHQVAGEGTKVLDTDDAYRLGFREEIVIPAESVRGVRYQRLDELRSTSESAPETTAESSEMDVDSSSDADTNADADSNSEVGSGESPSETADPAEADHPDPDPDDPQPSDAQDESETTQPDTQDQITRVVTGKGVQS
tara:strand:+ start:198092 stop:199819 length:1728 start_codon:yes stop_codon:yes gene_type:complete